MRALCDKYGVMLIMDEVITGFGRTGTWFATEQLGIEPDILNTAKSMGAGYAPIGAVMTRTRSPTASAISVMSILMPVTQSAAPPRSR